jgi:hypothetical protein
MDRYEAAIRDGERRGCSDNVSKFRDACGESIAVFACTLQKLHRETTTGTQLFETFHDLERLRLRASSSQKFDWSKLRPQAEIELFGCHEHLDKIHYACLSLDGNGLSSYGDCVVCLSDGMVAHRASCFEGNTAVIYAQQRSFSNSMRSTWGNRHIMCMAAMANDVQVGTCEVEFPEILLKVGSEPQYDRFIEVHVFGPMTAKTFSSIRIDATKHHARDTALRDAVIETLTGVDVQVTGL